MIPLNKYIYIATSKDIIFNLTMEEHFFNQHLTHPILYLYQNSSTVVIGKHQNPLKECNLNYMKKHNIILFRRASGGGAVYQDMGNICFSFLNTYSPQTDFKSLNSSLIIKGLKNAFSLQAVFNGRNDILYNNRKISGSAFRLEHNPHPKYIHHGTALINVDLNHMIKCLHPHKLKLQSNSVNSIRSRVVNMKEINEKITVDAFAQGIIKEFKKEYSIMDEIVHYIPDETQLKNDEVMQRYKYYKSWEWIYGESPSFTHSLVRKLSFGLIDLSFNVIKGNIKSINVYSDSGDSVFIDKLITLLRNATNKTTYAYNYNGLNKLFTNILNDSTASSYFNHLTEIHSSFLKLL